MSPLAPSYKQVQQRGFARVPQTAEGGHAGETMTIGLQLELHPIQEQVWHPRVSWGPRGDTTLRFTLQVT